MLQQTHGEPNRALSNPGKELRFGKKGALSVDLRNGVWHDHENQEGGGTLDLLKLYGDMEKPEAIEWMISQGMIPPTERRNGSDKSSGDKFMGFMDRHPEKIFDYQDETGKLAYQVLKFPKDTDGPRYMQRRPAPNAGAWVVGLQAGEYGQGVEGGHWFKAKEGKSYKDKRDFPDATRYLLHLDRVRKAIKSGATVVLCYSPDTEVLTPSGWVPFPDLKKTEMVAQYDLEKGHVSFAKPTAYQQFTYRGFMVNLKSDWCDLLVTPDHRQPSRVVGGVKRIRRAEDIKSNYTLPSSGMMQGGAAIDPAKIRLIAAWIADGVRERRGSKVSWNLKKDRKKDRLRRLLTEAGIQWSEFNPPSTPGWTGFRVKKADLSFIWDLVPDKAWPWTALQWSQSAREAVLDEVRYWDGDAEGVDCFRMFTSERQSADVISAVAAITNHHAGLRVDRRDGKADNYIVNLNPKTWRQISRVPKRVPYDGSVWCCTVPTGVLVVRRNGKVTISGNCEGEKDVETIEAWGLIATTNAGGAKFWTPGLTEALRGANVVLCSDNDEPGRYRTLMLGAELRVVAKSVRVLDLSSHWSEMPEKADVTDWHDQAAGTGELFAKLVDEASAWKPQAIPSKFKAIAWADMDAAAPEFAYLVDGWVPLEGRSVVGGPSQSGKSFLVLDMSLAVARGVPWLGCHVEKGGVIYQAGEGGSGAKKRVLAYRNHHGLTGKEDLPFIFIPSKVDLFAKDGDTAAFIEEIKAHALMLSEPLRLVVIDTLATATAGADENSGKDMSVVLANIAKIEQECKCHVMLVHHMNAKGEKIRGHTSIFADVDAVVTITNDNDTKVRTATLSKQKDDETGIKLHFELMSVKVGFNAKLDKDITSCVVLPKGQKDMLKAEQEKQGFSLNQTERRIMMNVFEAVRRHGKLVTDEKDGPIPAIGKTVVTYEQFRDVALEKMIDAEDRGKAVDQIRKEFARTRDLLIKHRVLGVHRGGDNPKDSYVWWDGRPLRGFQQTFPRRDAASDVWRDRLPPVESYSSPGLDEVLSDPDIPF